VNWLVLIVHTLVEDIVFLLGKIRWTDIQGGIGSLNDKTEKGNHENPNTPPTSTDGGTLLSHINR
jgi:hypothetical protein